MLQIYQPTEEGKQEDVMLVKESKEDMMREFEKAALRLDKAKLVCSLLFKAYHCCLRLFLRSFLGNYFLFLVTLFLYVYYHSFGNLAQLKSRWTVLSFFCVFLIENWTSHWTGEGIVRRFNYGWIGDNFF